MNLFEFSRLIASTESSMQFLQERGVIYDARRCPLRNCRRQMVLEKTDALAQYGWRCPADRKRRSLLEGSYFENAHLTLQQILTIIYTWTHDCTNQQINEFADVTSNTTIDYANLLREICSWKLLQQPIVLGGPNIIVQIDESVVARRKYNAGRIVPPRWVFGAYDVQAGLGYVQLVPDRSAATLLPIIANVVAPQSIIHSDSWRAYANVARLGYQHGMVNHRIEFVNRVTGVHTNNVERYWASVKQKIKRVSGSSEALLPSYLDEFMWRERNGRNHKDAFDNFLMHLSEWRRR